MHQQKPCMHNITITLSGNGYCKLLRC
uniref:Uncharacterized protein n=1 Tax=Anguilla anguilla TaxID=7936 RepID=A0A0E9RE14_ANGAN